MSNSVQKYIRANPTTGINEVAVIVDHTPEGSGWSSTNTMYEEQLLFDPEIVKYILDGESTAFIFEEAKKKYPGITLFGLWRSNLRVEWVPVGTLFRIEYDEEFGGREQLVKMDDMKWFLA